MWPFGCLHMELPPAGGTCQWPAVSRRVLSPLLLWLGTPADEKNRRVRAVFRWSGSQARLIGIFIAVVVELFACRAIARIPKIYTK
jgi:hypothetical protein